MIISLGFYVKQKGELQTNPKWVPSSDLTPKDPLHRTRQAPPQHTLAHSVPNPWPRGSG